uniref:Uncharacterized protein n=1 Tax=Physcomitrium patens TaxID=3218 RepID=A0A2K1ILZ9_PHYPA|nr:hypothetical protein PHYPA_026621 [Physcomitrium patens]
MPLWVSIGDENEVWLNLWCAVNSKALQTFSMISMAKTPAALFVLMIFSTYQIQLI